MYMTFLQRLRTPCKYSYKNATLVLIGINVLVYVLTTYVNNSFYYYFSLIPAAVIKATWLWQPITYMFVHHGFSHLVFNMLGILIFGMSVEKSIGTREFLLFYFITGILSGSVSIITYLFGVNIMLVGASGVVYALIFAFAVINPTSRIFIWGIIPVRAPILVVIYTAISIFYGVTGLGGNISYLTHLAGFIFAALYFAFRFRVNPIKRLIGK